MDAPKNWELVGDEVGVAFQKQGVTVSDPMCVKVAALRGDGQVVMSHSHSHAEMACPQPVDATNHGNGATE